RALPGENGEAGRIGRGLLHGHFAVGKENAEAFPLERHLVHRRGAIQSGMEQARVLDRQRLTLHRHRGQQQKGAGTHQPSSGKSRAIQVREITSCQLKPCRSQKIQAKPSPSDPSEIRLAQPRRRQAAASAGPSAPATCSPRQRKPSVLPPQCAHSSRYTAASKAGTPAQAGSQWRRSCARSVSPGCPSTVHVTSANSPLAPMTSAASKAVASTRSSRTATAEAMDESAGRAAAAIGSGSWRYRAAPSARRSWPRSAAGATSMRMAPASSLQRAGAATASATTSRAAAATARSCGAGANSGAVGRADAAVGNSIRPFAAARAGASASGWAFCCRRARYTPTRCVSSRRHSGIGGSSAGAHWHSPARRRHSGQVVICARRRSAATGMVLWPMGLRSLAAKLRALIIAAGASSWMISAAFASAPQLPPGNQSGTVAPPQRQTRRLTLPGGAAAGVKPGDTITIEADRITAVVAAGKRKYSAQGQVQIETPALRFSADEMTYDLASGEATASGHVAFDSLTEQVHIEGRQGRYNLRTSTGEFDDFQGVSGVRMRGREATETSNNPLIFSGRRLLRLGPDHYRLESGMVTSCTLPHPKWTLSAREVDVELGGNATLR